jgi:hypothetical protein
MASYLYIVDMKFFINGQKPIEPVHIKKLTKTFDYYEQFYPIYEADILMEMKYMLPLFKNKYNVYCNITITMRDYETEAKDPGPPIAERIIMDHIFIPFFSPVSFSNVVDEEDVKPNAEKSPVVSGFREMLCTLDRKSVV